MSKHIFIKKGLLIIYNMCLKRLILPQVEKLYLL